MTAYYNDFDPANAHMLRALIEEDFIPHGVVDSRSIEEVRPDDLLGFTQCHFFTGVGGWPLGARLAGWPDDRPLWTGSAPCQPLSVIGPQRGHADERHVWPAFSASSPSARLQWLLENKLAERMDANGSPEFALIWKQQDMPAGPPICRLAASVRRTTARGFTGLRAWATPSARDWKDTPGMAREATNADGSMRSRTDQLPRQAFAALGATRRYSSVTTGSLGVFTHELPFWLMGFPADVVSCLARAMQSFPTLPRNSFA